MFDELVESRPHRERTTRQLLASIVVHTAIIAVSIQLTRAVAATVTKHPVETAMFLARPPAPSTTRAASAATAPALAAAPIPLALPAPLVVPTSIPPVDLSGRFDPSRFSASGDSGAVPPGVIAGDSLTGVSPVTLQEVDDPVEWLTGPQPKYPPELRRVGVEGSVHLRYIVGVDGLAEPASIKVIKSTNFMFETPSISAILQARFKPARIKGHKVRQLVDQLVRFTLH